MRDAEEDEEEEEDDDEDSDDDNVQIVIDQGKIEEAKTTATFGIKPSSRQIPSERRGRFNVEDFDQVGTIDGTAAHEVDLENIEDKPWRKPGKQNYPRQNAEARWWPIGHHRAEAFWRN